MARPETRLAGHPELLEAAARVRSTSESDILAAKSALEAMFTGPETTQRRKEEAKEYAALKTQYRPLIADAKQLQQTRFPDTYGQVGRFLGRNGEQGLAGAIADTHLRLELHVAALTQQMKTFLESEEVSGLERASELYDTEKEILAATQEPWAIAAASHLSEMISSASQRIHDTAYQASRRQATARQYSQRLDTLAKDLAENATTYDALTRTVGARHAKKGASALLATSMALAQRALSLEEEVLNHGSQEQRELAAELCAHASQREHDAAIIYRTIGASRRTTLLRQVATATGVAVLAGLVLRGANYVPELIAAPEQQKTATAATVAVKQASVNEETDMKAPDPQRPSPQRPSRTYTLQRAIAETPGMKNVLYLSRNNHTGTLYNIDTSGTGTTLEEVLDAKCTFGRNPGNKERSGDNRTQEGAFKVDGYIWLGDTGRDSIYGAGCLNLEDKPFPGLQVTGTSLRGRQEAIVNGTDSTSGAASFLDEDFARIFRSIQERGSRCLVVIEDERRPLYR